MGRIANGQTHTHTHTQPLQMNACARIAYALNEINANMHFKYSHSHFQSVRWNESVSAIAKRVIHVCVCMWPRIRYVCMPILCVAFCVVAVSFFVAPVRFNKCAKLLWISRILVVLLLFMKIVLCTIACESSTEHIISSSESPYTVLLCAYKRNETPNHT